MRIAQVAPLHESVPPRLYGGTERVVSYLTEELILQGHQVTLFASGDSRTSAELRPISDRALRLESDSLSAPLAWHVLQAEKIAQQAAEFDVVHSHADFLLFPTIRQQQISAITTLHGRLDQPDLMPLFREFRDMRLISISDAQRAPMPWASWMATVYHGLPENLLTLASGSGGYLAFLGRVSPEKGLDRAIAIARASGMKLRIAAKIDTADADYFEARIKPQLNSRDIEFVGEIGESEKQEFLGNAAALLFPIAWPEPFGLVMIEAMACGTPIVAFPCGAVPEIVRDGVSGFLVSDVEAAVRALERIPSISRQTCRAYFEERFSARRMCQDYLRVYERVAEARQRAA